MKLKVYGCTHFARTGNSYRLQVRAIVAERSMAGAARAFQMSAHHLRQYGAETGNAEEVEVALAEPGVVFWRELDYPRGEWRRGLR
jgi:hypothetical protein